MMPRSCNQRPGEREYRSPGFGLISNHLRIAPGQNVLDLGAANTLKIEFLGELKCKIYVEHLSVILDGLNTLPAAETASVSEGVDQLLSYAEGAPFDVVLAWDLFNYRQPTAL
jgi:hypothetical protein